MSDKDLKPRRNQTFSPTQPAIRDRVEELEAQRVAAGGKPFSFREVMAERERLAFDRTYDPGVPSAAKPEIVQWVSREEAARVAAGGQAFSFSETVRRREQVAADPELSAQARTAFGIS